MLKEWIRNLSAETLQDIVIKAQTGAIRALAGHELSRRQTALSTAA